MEEVTAAAAASSSSHGSTGLTGNVSFVLDTLTTSGQIAYRVLVLEVVHQLLGVQIKNFIILAWTFIWKCSYAE